MNQQAFYIIQEQSTPFIAVALHDGHSIEHALKRFLLLDEQGRSREEDPYTWYMIEHLPITKVRVHASRFQTDLNRVKDKAIYQTPEDAWGLEVWNNIPAELIDKLYNNYDVFYEAMYELIDKTIALHGFAVVLDVHTYNHRRDSPDEQSPDSTHPEINLGTAYNSEKWRKLFTKYTNFISGYNMMNQTPDARENIIFKGGGFAQQIIKRYGDKCGVLSIEFKKTFMDEWTGVAAIEHIMEIKKLLSASLEFLQSEIKTVVN